MMERQRRKTPFEGDFPLLIIRKRGPLSIPCIIRMSRNSREFIELLKEVFTVRSIQRISTRTKDQSQSPYWFLYRRCLITGTLVKRVISQNQKDVSNPKLNRCISKYFPSNFKNEAMSYGIQNEQKALDTFFQLFKQEHRDPELINIGVIFYEEKPYIGGSPDGILRCSCCPKDYLVEVKCPYRLKTTGISSWKILEYFDENQVLKKSHTYNHQINLYQGILGIQTAFFVVYAKDEVIVKTLEFDRNFFDFIIENVSQYYMKHYLPTVISKRI